jgi:hypothetical protein
VSGFGFGLGVVLAIVPFGAALEVRLLGLERFRRGVLGGRVSRRAIRGVLRGRRRGGGYVVRGRLWGILWTGLVRGRRVWVSMSLKIH